MFTLWYQAGLLAVETGEVVQLRLWRICAGGRNAVDESVMMVREKVDAAYEAGLNLAAGSSLVSVIEHYRGYVAANSERLKTRGTAHADGDPQAGRL